MVPALLAVKGAGSSEVEALYLRAQELVDRLGKASLRFPVLWGLWFVKYNRGQYAAAREAGENLLDAGQTGGDRGQILEGHHALWALLSVMGNAEEAVRHMECGIALYDRKLHASQAFLYAGHHPGACCRYHLAKNLWLLGHLDQSMTVLKDALHLAEELKQPMTTAITLWFTAWVYYHRRDRRAMRASLEQLRALTSEHGIANTRDLAIVLLNAEAHPGRNKLSEIHIAFRQRERQDEGANWHRVFCVCVLAELCIEGGHAEDGLVLLAAISAEDREGFYAPEIHRLEGELRRQLPSPNIGEIERCFQAALALARQRAAKSLELRAATSLSRLWRDEGKCAEARDLLTLAYDWFTEGLDLPDLQNARDLIDDIGRPTCCNSNPAIAVPKTPALVPGPDVRRWRDRVLGSKLSRRLYVGRPSQRAASCSYMAAALWALAIQRASILAQTQSRAIMGDIFEERGQACHPTSSTTFAHLFSTRMRLAIPTACLRVSVAFGDLRGHCVLMPAALMSGHHFSISAFCSAPSASGVL